MAKKAVASLQTGSKRLTKAIKMVKKNNILEKKDHEINKLSEAIKSLNNNNIFKIYNSTKKILFMSFLITIIFI